jgi:flagellar hook-length control protein FliK
VNKNLVDDVKAVAEVKGINNAGKAERKMVPETPPDSPDKAPPASTPGVVTDRMKADPFTGKINEPARLAEAQSTEILRQISRQVAGSPNSGSQTIRIQLHPEDLGQIELRITSSSQGTHVSLIADQAGTGKLLETHIAQLKQTLSDAGVQMADVHVGQQAPQQSFRDPQSSQNPQQKNFKYDSRTVMGTNEIASNRSHSNSSLVDYRI